MSKKSTIARLSVLSNTILIILKTSVGLLTGSVSIISEAIHSVMDLIAAVIAYFSVKVSDLPPDKHHPYGHGKYENISGVIEALLIFIASLWIIYEAVKRISNVQSIDSVFVGFMVMIVSGIINFIVSRKLYKVARETDSIALEADALHLKADVYTTLGVAFGLLLIWLTKWYILDSIIAIAVAIIILYESYQLFYKAFAPLLDNSLPADDLNTIHLAITKFKQKYHNLRTRKAGHFKFIDFHLELPENISVKEAHDICDTIENEIKNKIRNAEITIHVESLDTIK